MNPALEAAYIAFDGDCCIGSGDLREVARSARQALGRHPQASILIFDRPRVLTIRAEPAVRDGSHRGSLAHLDRGAQESLLAGRVESCSSKKISAQ